MAYKIIISTITHCRSSALSADDMIFATLHFLATGSILRVVGDLGGIDKSTASRAINVVLRCIARLRADYVEMPTTQEEIDEIRQGFYNISRFPRCIGALDCTHVKIISPGGNNAEIFRNRKGYFSFNVQALCDSNLIIRNIVCRWPGSAHDSTIFANSRLRARLENQKFGDDSLVVGDSGYGIKNYLMTPLGNPQTEAEQLFNEAQIRTRNPIERCFGVLKRRFPILALGIRLHVDKVHPLVVASVVLHNIACQMNDVVPPVNVEIEAAIEVTNDVHLYQPQNVNANNITRHVLINNYFQSLL